MIKQNVCFFFFLHRCIFYLICLFVALLQPLAINGRDQRNRILANGPTVHHQLSSTLPPASSLQSLSPAGPTGNVTFANLPPPTTTTATNNEQKPMNSEYDEKEKLKNDLIQLKSELQKSIVRNCTEKFLTR